MRVLLAVLKDLFEFALSPFFGTPTPTAPSARSDVRERQVSSVIPSRFRSTAEIIGPAGSGEKNTIMYTGSTEALLFLRPTLLFDNVARRLPFGAMLMVLENRGRWARVVHHDLEGWILREELVDRAAHVYPHFVIGERNEPDDPNTIRVRALIGDEYGGAAADLPLQAEEYVHYRLLRKGIGIRWGEARPRLAGGWHRLLKGVDGVRMAIKPKAGDVFEYTREDGTGHVAFIEAVFPDQTVTISECNYPEGGMYAERVITHEEWRELRPVFISFS